MAKPLPCKRAGYATHTAEVRLSFWELAVIEVAVRKYFEVVGDIAGAQDIITKTSQAIGGKLTIAS